MSGTPESLIAEANKYLGNDNSSSSAASLLAIATMLKDTIDENRELDHRQEQFDKQDAVLGKLREGLEEMMDRFTRNGWPHISNDVRQIMNESGL